MFQSEYALDALHLTHGATKVRHPCLEDKHEHVVYKFFVSLYACLFSLVSIEQSEVHISGHVNVGIFLELGILQL